MIKEPGEPTGEYPKMGFYQLPPEGNFLPISESADKTEYFRRMVEEYGKEMAFFADAEYGFEAFQLNVQYHSTPEGREGLRSGKGLVFSNHPSSFDPAIIFHELIDEQRRIRDDIILISKRKNDLGTDEYEELVGFFGSKHFLPASKDPYEMAKTIRQATRHVEQGGLVVTFPGFTADREENTIKFDSGLSLLLEAIPEDALVHSFSINKPALLKFDGRPIDIVELSMGAGLYKQILAAQKDRKAKDLVLSRMYRRLHHLNLEGYNSEETY